MSNDQFRSQTSQNAPSASSAQVKAHLDPKFDPDSEETKTTVRNMIDCSTDTNNYEYTAKVVFGKLEVESESDKSDEELRAIMKCLFQHFTSWRFLNKQIFLYRDCILTRIAYCAPRLVIPFLKLEPPEQYERPSANVLGGSNLPAVMWTVYPGSLPKWFSTTTFNYLVNHTSDFTLRLCFQNTQLHLPLIHSFLCMWYLKTTTYSPHNCNFVESIQLLLTRADEDGGGGVDLRVTDAAGETAVAFMSTSYFSAEIRDDLEWQRAQSLLEAATMRAFEYGDKLLPTLITVLEASLVIKPLCELIASYSPASIKTL